MTLTIGATDVEAQGTGRIGDFCAATVSPANSCTANDVLIESFSILQVVESCIEGTPFEAEVVFNALVSGAQPNRYGIGLFINLEGESAATGDLCLHDYLAPFSSNPGDWQTDPMTGAFIAPFPEINGDQCGDVPGGQSQVLKTLQQVRIACTDATGNGFVDINACSSWENNQNATCSGLEDAVAGTPSKCGCTDVDTGLPLPASVTVVKETTEGDGTFDFSSTLPVGGFSITTVNGTGQTDAMAVDPGGYSISEDVPAGWELISATCDNGNSPGNLTVGPGDVVTCTFVDAPLPPEPGSITIVKNTVGGNGTFEYTGDLGAFGITTAGGTGSETFANLDADTYDVTETIPTGWSLDSIECSNNSNTDVGTGTANIEVAEGEDVTCTFTNSLIPPEPGSITIVKNTIGGNGTFEYTGDLGAFGITTGGGTGSETFANLDADTYDVTETIPTGWSLDSIECSNNSNTDVGTGTANIEVAKGEDVTCTFTNSLIPPEPGSITIVKNTVGGNGTFEYTGDLGAFDITTNSRATGRTSGNFAASSLDTTDGISGSRRERGTAGATTGGGGTGSQTFPNLDADTYDVTETIPAGWSLDSIECSNNSNTDVGTGTANIEVAKGEDVTCTFTNSLIPPEPGSITIVKNTIGGNGTFEYTGDLGAFGITTAGGTGSETFSNLDADTYDVSETIPAGWTLDSIECSNNSNTDVGTGTANIEVAKGEDVTCTFTNSLIPPEPGSITIVKNTVGGNGAFEYTGDLGAFGITTGGGTGSETFSNLDADTYDVSETIPAGWTLDSIECSNNSNTDVGTGTANIEVAKGEDVTCTFTNSLIPPEPGTVTIVKQAVGGNGTFTYGGDLGELEITTTDGTGSQVFKGVERGTYDVIEIVPAGWKLDSIECTNDSNTDVSSATAHVQVEKGEGVTCTFTNSLIPPDAASITIVKNTNGGDGSFQFKGTVDAFQISTEEGTGTRVLENLEPGTYDVVEIVTTGWKLVEIACSNPSATDVESATANIAVGAGEHVTCTYTNDVVEQVPTLPMLAAILLMLLLSAGAVSTLRTRGHAIR